MNEDRGPVTGRFSEEFYYEGLLPHFSEHGYRHQFRPWGVWVEVWEVMFGGKELDAEQLDDLALSIKRAALAPPYLFIWYPVHRHIGRDSGAEENAASDRFRAAALMNKHIEQGRRGRFRIYKLLGERVENDRAGRQEAKPATIVYPFRVQGFILEDGEYKDRFYDTYRLSADVGNLGAAIRIREGYRSMGRIIVAIYVCITEEYKSPE